MRRVWSIFLVAVVLLLAGFVADSARLLVIDQPMRADVIMVLAGETERRPARGLELLNAGYAPRMILNVPAGAVVYQWSQPELANKYVEQLPQAGRISICPIASLSTKAEAHDASQCLQESGARSVLLVTSDYHTRRALSTLRREVPAHEFFVAAAYDPREFGAWWWQHREWAKVNASEWVRLLWWEAVDRWY